MEPYVLDWFKATKYPPYCVGDLCIHSLPLYPVSLSVGVLGGILHNPSETHFVVLT